ncbi:MAG: HrcA family transcriptional regulator [Pseudoalteromonas sp.]|nr:HrcA family transcriptional regulator [Pseudoalteromonas sp.]|tara:strand:+ start:176 stop:1129 length:954 start_codon:yes stop_codon:yes gene_type:complete
MACGSSMKLSPRDQQIFTAVMSMYCNGEGVPVPSSKIAKQKGMAVCSATVRNAMARLEKVGLLCSPYTSAGRMPTEAGFKYWLDEYFDLPEIGNYWQPGQSKLVELAHALTQKYQVCCCVGLPQASSQLIFRVEVLGFDSSSWLVLLIDRAGQSQNILIDKPEFETDAQRYQFASWMNTVFSQQPLKEGLQRMFAMANSAPKTCMAQLTQWTSQLHQQLGSDNCILLGERHLYNAIDSNKELNLGVGFLHEVEDKLAFKNGVSLIMGNELSTYELGKTVVLSLPYFENGEYQSRFCVICSTCAPIEAIIEEFSLAST